MMSEETPCQHAGCGCHAAPSAPMPKPFTVGPKFVLAALAAVALIAFIVYLFVPMHWLMGKHAAAARSLGEAKFIYLTLNIYAHDNAGEFPQLPNGVPPGGENSNLVYQQLVPHYLNGHKENFHREGSPWTPQPLGTIQSGPGELAAGENHYAYVTGLSRTSPANLPLVADGFVDGRPGFYTTEAGQRGYVASGTAVVIRVDGSGSQRRILEDGHFPEFDVAEGGLSERQRVLNPAK